MKHSPPKWADRFLSWYCNPSLIEDIQGDAYELFERRCELEGSSVARRKFVWDVIRFFRWSNIKRSNSKYQTNRIPMFKNYLKVGLRNLSKNLTVSIINVFGLSLAVGCAITVFIFIDFQHNVDTFHKNADNIYQVINFVEEQGEIQTWGDSPILIGPDLESKFSSVKRMARIEYQRGNLRYDDKVFNELTVFTDPDFLRIFDYPLLYGSKDAMDNKEQIVISYDYAIKYFGDENPMGKTVSIKFTNGEVQSFFVGAVFDEFPQNRSFAFNVLVPMENFFDLKLQELYNWSHYTDATFLELYPDQDPVSVASEMKPYIDLQNATDTKWPIQRFELWPLKDLALRNFEIRGSVADGSHPAGRITLAVIAGLLLVLACFNYMNLAVAASTKRLKEIALRKVLGSARRGIISQFLVENVLLCLFALLLGTIFCYTLLLPGFNILIPIYIPFAFSSFTVAASFFLGLLLLTGIISGSYPAFYIARFQPVHIFRGSQKFGRRNIFSRVMLTFQLIIAFTTVIGSFVFTDNALYLKEKDWGYDQANIMSIPVIDKKSFDGIRDKALQNTDVKSFSGSVEHIGRFNRITTLEHLENRYSMIHYRVGYNYLETMNIRLKEGRFFDRNTPSDLTESVVVTESLIEVLKFDDPLNEVIKFDSLSYRIIGVVEDFYYDDFYSENHPVFFRLAKEEDFGYAIVKTEPGKEKEVDEYLRAAWLEVAPNDPYDRMFQNDVFLSFFTDNESNIIVISAVAVFAIVLASIGLFGLLSFSITKRMKEFSIRKTLGADELNIIKLANKEYVWILLIAFLIGAPAGYFSITQLINLIYPEPQGATVIPFVTAMGIMIITVLVTVSGQIIKASKVNPAQILRNE